MVLCDFDDMELPDHSTVCRYRNWLIKYTLLEGLLEEPSHQLTAQRLKVGKAPLAVVDASIIETPAQPQKKALELDTSDAVHSAPVSKDTDAKRVKQGARVYLGYTLHACSDAEGYIDWRAIIPVNGHASHDWMSVCDHLDARVRVLAEEVC
jgi:IS5 family transposase